MEKPRLLIIDDAVNLSLLYKEELLDEGYDVDVAHSIHDANKLLDMISYNLMIVETNLKWKNEYENLYAILKNKKYEVPVIINTGTPMSEVDLTFYSFIAYIEKSSDLSPLKEIVYDTLQNISLKRDGNREDCDCSQPCTI